MKKLALLIFLGVVGVYAQQPQTHDLPPTEPLFLTNTAWVNGVGPGYWPTAGSGLTLNLSAGTANCAGSIINYSGGTLTMTDSATNQIYLDTSASCAPAVKTTPFVSADIPVAIVVASGGVITVITDIRTQFEVSSGGGTGSVTHTLGALTALHIPAGNGGGDIQSTNLLTDSGLNNLTIPGIATVNGTGGTSFITLSTPGAAPAVPSTGVNLIAPATVSSPYNLAFFTALPTTGHVVTATVSGSTVTLTDGGAPGSGSVTSIATTSPILGGTITSTGTISCQTADTSHAGCLTSTDWNTFNGKGSGTVTSVATGTGLTGGPITTTGTVTLADTAVTPGAYTNLNATIDQQGRVTAAANGTGGGGGAISFLYTNEGTTGTTTNKLAKWSSTTGTTVKITATADGTSTTPAVPLVGVVSSGAGTTGLATIISKGPASCVFDGATTAGDYVVLSTTTVGDCHDGGSSNRISLSTGTLIIGVVETTNGGGGTYTVDLGEIFSPNPSYSANYAFFPLHYFGSQFSFFGNIGQEGNATTDAVSMFAGAPFRLRNGADYTEFKQVSTGHGATQVNVAANTGSTSTKVDFHVAQDWSPGALGNISGSTQWWEANSNFMTATLTGNVTSFANIRTDSGTPFCTYLQQDGTGGRSVTWGVAGGGNENTFIGPSPMPAAASSKFQQCFIDVDAANAIAVAPAIPISVKLTGKTASISATNLGMPAVASLYRACGAIQDTTTDAGAATMASSIIYNDINGTSQTDALVAAVSDASVNNHGGACIEFYATTGAAIQYSATEAGTIGTGVFALQFTLELLGQ